MVPAMLRSVFLKYGKITARRSLYTSSSIQNDNIENGKRDVPPKKKMDDYFILPQVQSLLKGMTGLDLEKIFKPRHVEFLFTPRYKFVTDKQLQEMKQEAVLKAHAKLQMPPVMEVQDQPPEILSYDPELQGYEESNLLFIDISLNIPERERTITVREPDGTLRLANRKERFRMNEIFFPREGRNIDEPIMFQSPYLEKLLDEGSYIFVLDRACVQYDPDEPEYHAATKATYEHINSQKKFDELRSTRHFGPMAFYLAWNNKIEKLLVDMVERELILDASHLVKLLYIIHPELQPEEEIKEKDSLDLVKDYIRSNTSEDKPNLELAIQTYLEVLERRNKAEPEEASASS